MRRYTPIFLLIVVIVLIQLATSTFNVQYYLTQLTMTAYYVMVALGLCMLMGYAGQISLGQAGFFAIGGYTSAVLTTLNLLDFPQSPIAAFFEKAGLAVQGETLYGDPILYITPWIAFIIAIIVTILIAFIIGLPVLSLKGHYLAMATLGFGIIIYRIVLGTPLFGEADGISSVPGFSLIPGLEVSGDLTARIQNFYIAWGLVVIGLLVLLNLINSRVGRALRALHGSEEAAGAMGVPVARYKFNVFLLGAVFGSIAGVFLTHYNGGIGPSEASVIKSVRYVAIVAVGGMANLWGTLVMGALLNFLSLRGVFGSYDDAVFGVILILIMMFAPEGFLRMQVLVKLQEALGFLRRARK